MKMLAKIRRNEIYCAETRDGGLAAAAEEASRDTIAGCRRSNTASIRSNYSVARHSYHWLMINHAMMKKRIVTNQNRATAFSILKGRQTAAATNRKLSGISWEWDPATATQSFGGDSLKCEKT